MQLNYKYIANYREYNKSLLTSYLFFSVASGFWHKKRHSKKFINFLTRFKPNFAIREKLALRKKCPYSEFFWFLFSRIWIEYKNVLYKSLSQVWMRRKIDHNNSEHIQLLCNVVVCTVNWFYMKKNIGLRCITYPDKWCLNPRKQSLRDIAKISYIFWRVHLWSNACCKLWGCSFTKLALQHRWFLGKFPKSLEELFCKSSPNNYFWRLNVFLNFDTLDPINILWNLE